MDTPFCWHSKQTRWQQRSKEYTGLWFCLQLSTYSKNRDNTLPHVSRFIPKTDMYFCKILWQNSLLNKCITNKRQFEIEENSFLMTINTNLISWFHSFLDKYNRRQLFIIPYNHSYFLQSMQYTKKSEESS